jgi:hypothetical protein
MRRFFAPPRSQFTKSEDAGSITRLASPTSFPRGQSNVALPILQPGMNIGALAGGASNVSGVKLRSWSIVCAT